MPLECANAFSPTIALLRCTGKPLIRATSFEALTISLELMPQKKPRNTSLRVWSAITISSNAALPARSPMPFTVHSTCRAPAFTAANELATATLPF